MSWSDWFVGGGTGGNAQTYDEAQANYAAQLAKLKEQTDKRTADGTLDARQIAERNRILNGSLENQDAAAADGFKEGLSDGVNNIFSTIGSALKIVPTPVWVAAGVAGFLYLGGGAFVVKHAKGILKPKV